MPPRPLSRARRLHTGTSANRVNPVPAIGQSRSPSPFARRQTRPSRDGPSAFLFGGVGWWRQAPKTVSASPAASRSTITLAAGVAAFQGSGKYLAVPGVSVGATCTPRQRHRCPAGPLGESGARGCEGVPRGGGFGARVYSAAIGKWDGRRGWWSVVVHGFRSAAAAADLLHRVATTRRPRGGRFGARDVRAAGERRVAPFQGSGEFKGTGTGGFGRGDLHAPAKLWRPGRALVG